MHRCKIDMRNWTLVSWMLNNKYCTLSLSDLILWRPIVKWKWGNLNEEWILVVQLLEIRNPVNTFTKCSSARHRLWWQSRLPPLLEFSVWKISYLIEFLTRGSIISLSLAGWWPFACLSDGSSVGEDASFLVERLETVKSLQCPPVACRPSTAWPRESLRNWSAQTLRRWWYCTALYTF